MMQDYGAYIEQRSSDITALVEEMQCQPILFIGSGLSRRYFNGPSWEGLLDKMASDCPEVPHDLEYYLQGGHSYPEIGSILAEKYYDWAWGDGKDEFPEELRSRDYDADIYLKYKVSEHFKEITPTEADSITEDRLKQEIDLLSEIQPHTIVTTNYDQLLESIFPDYSPVVGEKILRSDYQSVGEIIKIHGCVTEPERLVLTQEDYTDFNQRKKYLAAKLLTYFAEHPVLVAGYGVGDENVQKILADIDEILSPEDGLIPNIYFLEWENDIHEVESFEFEKVLPTVDDKSVRINYIRAKWFDWVFDAFGSGGYIEGVNLKLLRTILANTYDIVRTKAPRREIEINYKALERAAKSEDALATLFGVTTLDNPPDMAWFYRYKLSDVAEELGYGSDYGNWNHVQPFIEQIAEETGVNIKDSDNVYHMDIAFNSDYEQHRYSDAAIELLRKVRDEEDYELDMRFS